MGFHGTSWDFIGFPDFHPPQLNLCCWMRFVSAASSLAFRRMCESLRLCPPDLPGDDSWSWGGSKNRGDPKNPQEIPQRVRFLLELAQIWIKIEMNQHGVRCQFQEFEIHTGIPQLMQSLEEMEMQQLNPAP